MNKILVHAILFPLFFTIFYIESISIGGVKIAILWKLIFIGFVGLYIFLNMSNSRMQKFVLFGYLYSLKNLFTLSPLHYFMSSLSEAIKSSFIPLLAQFFSLLQQKRNINLYQLLLTVSIYIIISSIPFLLGLIEPLKKGYDLGLFGDEAYGFIGIFQGPHAAAVTISSAIIVLVYESQLIENRNKKMFYFLLILLGVWIEIQTFARTGFAILFVVLFYLLLMKKKFIYYLRLLPLGVILLSAAWYYYQSSPMLQMRLSGTNKYMEKSQTEADVGSGRFKFSATALENWSYSGVDGVFFGFGIEKAKDMMDDAIGMRIFAHNGFIDVIQFNGLIGIFLYLSFLYYLFMYIKQRERSKHTKLVKALFLAYLVAMFFQGEHYFLADLLFTISLAIINKNSNEAEDRLNV